MSTLNKDPRIVDLVVDPINKIKITNHTVGIFQKSSRKSIEEENSILLITNVNVKVVQDQRFYS
jgi:hypothetical protein